MARKGSVLRMDLYKTIDLQQLSSKSMSSVKRTQLAEKIKKLTLASQHNLIVAIIMAYAMDHHEFEPDTTGTGELPYHMRHENGLVTFDLAQLPPRATWLIAKIVEMMSTG